MTRILSKALIASWALLLITALRPAALGQTTPARDRIAGPVDDSRLVRLPNNTHPLARPEFDRGPAPPSLPLDRMRLVLIRSPQQEADLEALLATQQDRLSPSFHQWLTPAQFGERFGPSDQDIQVVASWLASQGFQVNNVAAGRTAIEFSGTAGEVLSAFHTRIHKYVVHGEEHWANQSDPRIPAALAPVVAGVATLHNFRAKPAFVEPRRAAALDAGPISPDYNLGAAGHGVSPADFSTIYGLKSVYSAGINGAGVVIGVLGDDQISLQDVADFRRVFGLPSQIPEVIVSGTTPDFWTGDNSTEGVLDVEWTGAVAPGATIKYIIGAQTDVSDGLALAEQYAVDNDAADILTESYLYCEADMTAAQHTQLNALRQQAAAQGITWLAASGDSGSYCDAADGTIGPLTVNGLASSPYVIAVGGTEFSIAANTIDFWSSTNNPSTYSSALSYIPEVAWNDTCQSAGCPNNVSYSASGGGASAFYAKPAWQAGVAGIPNDGFRDIPDVSLVASPENSPYLTCYNASCETSTIGPSSFSPLGGTSASTQAFGGVMALIDQKTKSRQGQANYVLYRLAAAEQYSQCVAYNSLEIDVLPAPNCVFNDVTTGNNTVPGEAGWNKTTGNYQAGPGYDLVTGLGSVKVNELILQWNSIGFLPTSTSLAVNPAMLMHGSAATVNATVMPSSGTGVPTGDIALLSSSALAGGVFALNEGTVSSATSALPGGSYQLTARYSGDGTFAASVSPPESLTVTPEPITATVGAIWDPSVPGAYYSGGTYGTVNLLLRADVAGLSGQGYPSGAVTFLDNGKPIGGGGQMDSLGHAISEDSSVVFSGGEHVLIAQYAGDASFQPGISLPALINVTKAPTITGVQSNITTVTAGQSITLSASVISYIGATYGIPETGTITFSAEGTPLGPPVAISTAVDPNSNLMTGTASLPVHSLPLGSNSIAATFNGDVNYAGSTSQTLVVNVVSTAPSCVVSNFTADPNPNLQLVSTALVTVSITADCAYDMREFAPDGTLQVSATGATTTQLGGGGLMYLQRHGDTTPAGTLQTLLIGFEGTDVPCQVYGFAATPNPIISPTLSGSTTVSAVASCEYTIRSGSPAGPILASSVGNSVRDWVASSTTGNSVTDGTQFYMVSTAYDNPVTMASLTVRVLKSQPACYVAQFSANPQRILTPGPLGVTTITAQAGCAFDIRIGGPDGTLFASASGYASTQTGAWVSDGMTFYLQRAGDTTAAGTIATTTVFLLSGDHSLCASPGGTSEHCSGVR